MKILTYNDLAPKGLSAKVNKVKKLLASGDFRSADVKKMVNSDFYRAKLDRENRLLFKFARYEGETYLLLLEVIANHAYEKSKFLRGAEVQESHFRVEVKPETIEKEVQESLRYVNPQSPRFHVLDKIISLDETQEEIYQLPSPLIIIGSAGSGKTALTLEKMKSYRGNMAYISLSPYLVENSQQIYYANGYENEQQEIDFLDFGEYLESIHIPEGKELTYPIFDGWYERRYRARFKFRDSYKLFEEFRGVLTGSVVDAAYLSRERYRKLGVKQSIFLENEREQVYDLFEKYLAWLEEGQYFDRNLLAYQYLKQVEPTYDFIVVDEVQDLTNIQLLLILRALKQPTNFILSGDSNQIVHPNFFSWSKIKTLFFEQQVQGNAIRILKTNYRNSQQVTRVSNDLLKIKNARFGSIDRESTYLIDTVSSAEGEIQFFQDSEKIKQDLNARTERSAKFAVLVMDKAQKRRVSKFFKTPLIFTIQEAKGLEYDNIILINFLSDYAKEFREITRGVTQEDLLDENLRYSRGKDKSNKEQEAYKFYINSLYVAFTRAVKNLYIVEGSRKFELLQLLDIVETSQKVQLQVEASDDDEWLEEARRLELQGKTEQAEAIRAKIKGIEFVGQEEAAELLEKLLAEEEPLSPRELERLFLFAKSRHRVDLIQTLYLKGQYGPAKQYVGEYQKAQKSLLNTIRHNNQKQLERILDRFGSQITEPTEGMSGLMVAAQYGKAQMMKAFLDRGASIKQQDRFGRTPLQHLLLGFDRQKVKYPLLKQWYDRLAPANAQCRYAGRLYFISRKSMEYYLLNLLNALRLEVFDPEEDFITKQGLLMDDFMELIEEMPPNVLADYRRKRQYVNSILAKNEVERNDPYNRKLFIRRSRGCYDLLPEAEVSWG